MPELMKKRPIKLLIKQITSEPNKIILRITCGKIIYNIPKEVADQYKQQPSTKTKGFSPGSISPEKFFEPYHKKYTRAGFLLKGARHREGLTQVQMAKKIGITQADLSKMENGKRPIGKAMAKRLAKLFKTDYRNFL